MLLTHLRLSCYDMSLQATVYVCPCTIKNDFISTVCFTARHQSSCVMSSNPKPCRRILTSNNLITLHLITLQQDGSCRHEQALLSCWDVKGQIYDILYFVTRDRKTDWTLLNSQRWKIAVTQSEVKCVCASQWGQMLSEWKIKYISQWIHICVATMYKHFSQQPTINVYLL